MIELNATHRKVLKQIAANGGIIAPAEIRGDPENPEEVRKNHDDARHLAGLQAHGFVEIDEAAEIVTLTDLGARAAGVAVPDRASEPVPKTVSELDNGDKKPVTETPPPLTKKQQKALEAAAKKNQ